MSAAPNYETMYILRPDIAEEEVENHANKYRDMVIEAGGQVIDSQLRGKRRLAYTIGKHREGIYVQLNYSGDGQQVAPLERAMRLSEDVIRYLTVKYDGQHTSLGRSTTPVASTETSTSRTDREPREQREQREPVAASAPAGDDD
ncbi:MAG: 30S ribosomal protein S6 [Cyanobacteriota bacterium]